MWTNRYVNIQLNFLFIRAGESINIRMILMHTIQLLFMAYWNTAQCTKLIAWTGLQPNNPYITARLKTQREKVTKQYLGKLFIVEVRCLELLGKVNMSESDIPIIKAAINAHLIGSGLTVDDCFLGRIDYCYNVVIPNCDERRLLMRLWNKSASQWGYYRQFDGPSNTINRLYYTTKSRNFQLYDKTLERMDKGRPILSVEQDVLRLEVQLKRRRLNYKSNKLGLCRTFDDWADWTHRAQELCAADKLFFPGDFYTIRRADTRVRNAGHSKTICGRIHDFLVCISRNGLDGAKQNHSANTVRKYIRILEALNVNPITIPQGAGYSYLANPFRAVLAVTQPDK